MSGYNHSHKRPGQVLNIHVGMNKTGSTSLQRFLFANREVLRTQGINYPDNDEFMFYNAHHRLAGSLLPGYNWKALQEFAGGKDDPEIMVSILGEELARSGSRHFVISSELFAVENAEKVASGLEGAREFYDIRTIVYIRNYPDFMESLLAHRITYGDGEGEEITEEFKRDFCLRLNGHYRRVIDSYALHFGRDNIEVRILEKEQLYGGSIISDFLHLMDLENNNSLQEAEQANVSLKRNGLEYMMILNRMDNGSLVETINTRIMRGILKALSDGETCSLFSSGLRSDIVSWTENECSYIAREYLGREDCVLFNNPQGKDIPGGETYRGLDPEYAVNAGLAIINRAVGQGAFSGMNRTAEKQPDDRTTARELLKSLCLRVPGSRMLQELIKRQG